jgi:hypothetical protein
MLVDLHGVAAAKFLPAGVNGSRTSRPVPIEENEKKAWADSLMPVTNM